MPASRYGLRQVSRQGVQVEWRRDPDTNRIKAYARKGASWTPVLWHPMPGSQSLYMSCPVTEVLYEGTRGPGKTDALLMSFAQHVGKWGKEWVGIIFRRTYPELDDVINKSLKWFTQMFPHARYNRGEHFWEWPSGERLMFRHMKVPEDYNSYHGHSYPFIGFEELTTWPSPDCYVQMLSTCRSTVPDMPRMIRATTNPYGPGHNWVKARWRLPLPPGETVGPVITGEKLVLNGRPVLDAQGQPIILPPRVAIRGRLEENFLLHDADPNYVAMISASARNAMQLKAWLEGSWDIVSGGMFDDVWDPHVHLVPPFQVPKSWRMDRSFDWGSSKPFSVGWWAESDGTNLTIPLGKEPLVIPTVRGDLFRIGEWYGWCGEPDKGLYMVDWEIAEGVLDREVKQWPHRKILPGPADTSIFDHVNNHSIADGMAAKGVYWDRADKSSGSRINGWEAIRSRLKNSLPRDGLPREHPGLYVCSNCDQFLRTFPVLPRSDKNLDDVDTEAEDHLADEVRYKILASMNKMVVKKLKGR